MAWRNPRYSHLNALADAYALAPGSITTANAVDGSFPITRLFDWRGGPSFKFAAAMTDHTITIDRGAGTLVPVDRVFIPWQQFAGSDFRMFSDDNPGFSSSTTIFTTSPTVAGEPIDESFSPVSERYIRFNWPGATSDVMEMTELVLSATLTTTRGPEPKWRDDVVSHAEQFTKASGARAVISTGSFGRLFSLRYARTPLADTTTLDAFVRAVGIAHPFLFDPPFDDETPIIARFTEDPISEFDHPSPAGGERERRYTFEIEKVIE